MNTDEQFIHRCIDIALKGIGHVAPNPMVGSVIVHNDVIIGEGFHEQYGGPHAEVNAIRDAEANQRNTPPLLRRGAGGEAQTSDVVPNSTLRQAQDDPSSSILSYSILYVNLEPCAHHGKTPPCTDLIISKKIPKVVIGSVDPNPLVAGKGIQKLKDAGVEVVVGVLEKECNFLNRRFFTSFEKKRPYIILKWAQTKDGFIAPLNHKRKQISNAISRELVHKWRSEEQAILVGYNTARFDNPELNVRLWQGKNPLRCVIDKELMLPQSLHLFDGKIPTVVFTDKSQTVGFASNETFAPVGVFTKRNQVVGENTNNGQNGGNLQLIRLDFSGDWLNELLHCLHKLNIQSVIVEGGAKTLEAFITQSLWDEARVFTSEDTWGEGISAPTLNTQATTSEKIQSDTLSFFYNK